MGRYSSLRGALIARLRLETLTAVALLCLALGACGGSPAPSGTARATSTTNSLNAPSGGGCNSCIPPVPTITVTPARLTVSPTTVTRAQVISLTAGPAGSGTYIATFDLTLTNASSTTSLAFSITGVQAYTFTANPIARGGSSLVQIRTVAPDQTVTFDVIGPANTVTVTVDSLTP